MEKKVAKLKKYAVLAVITFALVIISLFAFNVYAAASVTVDNCGSRLVAHTTDIAAPVYQWQRSDKADNGFVNISGANDKYYDLTTTDSGKFLRVVVNGVQSDSTEQIGELVVFDIAKGGVSLGATYSGKDSSGNTVSGTHIASNLYVVRQSNNTVSTTNNISFSGNLVDKPFDVTLDGVNLYEAPTNNNQAPGSSGSNTPTKGMIYIPASAGGQKKVTLRLKGENCVRFINYYVAGDSNTPVTINSSLKITDINGDGSTDGGSLYVPKKVAPEEIDAFVATNINYNHWNAGIGGTDGSSQVQNLTLAGGKIQVLTTLGDNCSAIGAGGNGYGQVTITGGEIIAHANGTGAAIGGGIGWNAAGGKSEVLISGGKVYAKNHAYIHSGDEIVGGVAIGSGSSFHKGGTEGKVTITGGVVEAYGTFGNGIGGGNSSASTGGDATVEISGGTVTANSIGGGNSKSGAGGKATVDVYNGADITILAGIGGGKSLNGTGGGATVNVYGGTMNCGGVIGGGEGSQNGDGGKAIVKVQDGVLVSKGIGGGIGGTLGAGGAAEVYISGGVIETGSIGGGTTNNPNGALGYAKAVISGGDIVGQFIMAKGGTKACTFEMSGGVLHGVDTSDSSKYSQLDGGAVYMDDPNGQAVLSGGKIEVCSARKGGAVYMTGGTFTISGTGIIEDCTASENGGAVYLGGGNLCVNGGEISKNSAKNGGAVYLGGGTLAVTDGEICLNTVSGSGGAAYVNGGDVDISGGSIISNTAEENGGAIAINNGNYGMIGGSVDFNEAKTGKGGAIYVTTQTNTSVLVLSGSISSNKAGTSGGAIAVVGEKGNTNILIETTIGVNNNHYSEGNFVGCDHGNGIVGPYCPVINNNLSGASGGAIYISGGDQTKLNTYCLVESGNKSLGDYPPGLETSRSDFMMVEGGKVLISTAENNVASGNDGYGKILITTSMHITAGKVDLMGSMSNPEFKSPITVDIETEEDYFNDQRKNQEDEEIKYYKLQYYENFTDTQGDTSGQYTVYQIKHGESHIISGNIYSHKGYEIVGWFPKDEKGEYIESQKYEVGETYTFVNVPNDYTQPGDLTIYAVWSSHYYEVVFNPNVPTDKTYYGTMEQLKYVYDTEETLPLNQYVYPGYRFTGWYDALNDKTYADGQKVKNLSAEDGKVVELLAQWTDCLHEGTGVTYTYTANGAALTRTCSCIGYAQTATMYPEENAVYNGELHPVTIVYSETNSTNYTPSEGWSVTPSYSGVGSEPRNAGEYTATLTQGVATATVDFVIDKAMQEKPGKPSYQEELGAEVTVLPNANDGAEKAYDYRLAYYSGTTVENTDWQSSATIILPKNYTNYIVYIRYAEDENHYASEEVRADEVFYYSEEITINISCCEGFQCFLLERPDLEEGGLYIYIVVQDGFYKSAEFDVTVLTNYNGVDIPNSDSKAAVVTDDKRYLTNIGLDGTFKINLTVVGAKKLSSVTANVAANQVFGTVAGDGAIITRDSAFTVYYSVKNYNNYEGMKLVFTVQIPAQTTVMFIDKSGTVNSYWYYRANAAISEIAITSFTALGSTDAYVEKLETGVESIEFAYQFIVDFSKTANGMSGDSLTMLLSATSTDSGQMNFSSAVSVTLVDMPTFGMSIASASGLTIELDIEYALAQAGASKWDYRKGALVFTPLTGLPIDAQLRFQVGSSYTLYLQNAQGQFIIPLNEVGNRTVSISLTSKLFPVDAMEYSFKAELYAAESLVGAAPINGDVMATIETVKFTKAETVLQSLHIRELSSGNRLYKQDETIRVWIEMINIDAVTVTLLRKSEEGDYVNTGWNMRTLTESGELSVGLGGQNPGSFCILLTVRDEAGATILSVPFYFIVMLA